MRMDGSWKAKSKTHGTITTSSLEFGEEAHFLSALFSS